MNQQLFSEARRELERRRQRAETAAMDLKNELYKAEPELARLDALQAEAGSQAAAFGVSGQHQQAEEMLAKVKQIHRQKLELLNRLGYSEEKLKPKYYCDLCEDTGWVKGSACQCLEEIVRGMQREDINGNGPLSLCRFENFDLGKYPDKMQDGAMPRQVMAGILADCKDYAEHFGPRSGSLFMYGDAGLGKTHLALSIASQVLDKGYDVIYVSSQSAFSEVSAARFDQGGEIFRSMMHAQLLILDDLGTEFIDAFVLSKLYELVNGRQQKPTIYTTNICRQDLLYQRYTEKIASRLMGGCHLMRFHGNDIRLLK